MKATLLLCLILGLASCYKPTKKVELKQGPIFTEPEQVKPLEKGKTVAFEDFLVDKGRLGPITIGMTIEEAEQHLAGLIRQDVSSLDFGLDGDSEAYMYSKGEEPILALIPAMDNDTIVGIAAIHKKLKTSNGLSANAKVQDLLKIYPGIEVHISQIFDWEEMWDTDNQWSFVFMTEVHDRIGKYPTGLEETAKPLRKGIKADWILIK